jgi:hypothetical protein
MQHRKDLIVAALVVVVLLAVFYYTRRTAEDFYGSLQGPMRPPYNWRNDVRVWNPDYSRVGDAELGGSPAAINFLSGTVPGVACQLGGCKTENPWDPAAVAEAQGLAQVGAFQHTDYNEKDLQDALTEAYRASQGYPYAYVQ